MSLPVASFANLAAGNQPLSLLDQQFNAIAATGVLPCGATGTNTIALTPLPNVYAPASYISGQKFSWVQPITTVAGPVTINFLSLGAITAYKANGQVMLGAGDLVGGCVYTATYSSALGSGSGGFAVDALPSAGPPGAPGAPGQGVPAGGATGQVLAKNSATNYDTGWATPSGGGGGITDAPSDSNLYARVNGAWSIALPRAGTVGQVLTKASSTDFAATWQTPAAGGASVVVSDTAPASPTPGQLWWDSAGALMYLYYADPTSNQWVNINNYAGGSAAVMRSYLAGLGLSTAGSSTSFTVAAGMAADSTNATMMSLPAAITKTTAPWSAGSAGGALDTGGIANNAWYHVHLIQRTDAGVTDVLISLSPAGPALPLPYTFFRRIGSMKTNASGQWTLFSQLGDEFLWSVAVSEQSGIAVPGSATLITLVGVPPGLQMRARLRLLLTSTTGIGDTVVQSPDEASGATSATGTDLSPPASGRAAVNLIVRTNVSAQVKWDTSGSSVTAYLFCFGWYDRRGQDN